MNNNNNNNNNNKKLNLSAICTSFFQAVRVISDSWGTAKNNGGEIRRRKGAWCEERTPFLITRLPHVFGLPFSALHFIYTNAWKRPHCVPKRISHKNCGNFKHLTTACLTFADSSLIPRKSSSVALCTRFKMLNH